MTSILNRIKYADKVSSNKYLNQAKFSMSISLTIQV